MDLRVRAWDAKRGRMLEGDFVEDCHPTYRVSLAYGKLTVYDTTGGDLVELPTMLATGTYDRDGKLIYEGDVDISDTPPMVVVFKDGAFGLEFADGTGFDSCIHWDCIEVGGNIYQDSHLLTLPRA